jgi:alkylation response protein AidB-like acyl-CoA dehydrogenase
MAQDQNPNFTSTPVWGSGPSPRYEALAARFRPVFARIASGTIVRERTRYLPFEAIGWLKEARFGALRLTEAEGGFGATLPELFELVTELAEADSNLSQILRIHLSVVEKTLSLDAKDRSRDAARIATGTIWGGALTERSAAKIGSFATTVTPDGDGYVLEGEKFYSTGALFADRMQVVASGPDGQITVADIATDVPGLTLEDDWDGFGQRLTGSGTSRYDGIRLAAADVSLDREPFRYQAAFFQTVHLATLAGIGRAAARDLDQLIQTRTRTFSHASARLPKNDVQILQIVGRIHAKVYAVNAIVRQLARALEEVWQAFLSGDAAKLDAATVSAEIEASQAQSTVIPLILEATTGLFDALGASSTSTGLALDRHWRNARTLACHNPVAYKERVIGDYVLNQTPPPYSWLPGEG